MIRFASAGVGKSAEIGGNPPELFLFYDSFSSYLVKFHHEMHKISYIFSR